MARVKRAVHSKKHRRAVLERAKGYYGNKSRSYRAANEQVMHSLQYAFRDRRARKGEFRKLWIQRINAACRQNGISYSRFIAGLKPPASRSTARSWPTSPSPTPPRSPRSSRSRRGAPADRRAATPRPRAQLRREGVLTPPARTNPRIQRLRRLSGRRSARATKSGVRRSRGRAAWREALAPAWPLEAVFVEGRRRASTVPAAVRHGRRARAAACSSGSPDRDAPARSLAVGRAATWSPSTIRRPRPAFVVVLAATSATRATPARSCARPRPPVPTAVVVARGSVDVFNPKVVRAVGRRAVPRRRSVADGRLGAARSLGASGVRRLGARAPRRRALRRGGPDGTGRRSCSAARRTGCRRRGQRRSTRWSRSRWRAGPSR